MDINEQSLTKKQRRELRKHEKLANKNEEQSKKRRTQILVWVGILLILGAGIYGLTQVDNINLNTNSSSKVDTITEQDNTQGNPAAGVVLIEYSDFQCPACAAFQGLVKGLLEEYQDSIYFAYRNFPLRSIHKNSQVAAQAAEAAALQDKFWEMHDKLFDNQNDWSNESDPTEKFASYAEEIGLDVEKFKIDLGSDSVKDKVDNDYNGGNAAKVNSTPTFFLNGEKISNPKSLEDFKKLIDEKLSQLPVTTEATDSNQATE